MELYVSDLGTISNDFDHMTLHVTRVNIKQSKYGG